MNRRQRPYPPEAPTRPIPLFPQPTSRGPGWGAVARWVLAAAVGLPLSFVLFLATLWALLVAFPGVLTVGAR